MLRSCFDGLKTLLRKARRDAEMDEELSGYLQAAAEDKMRSGMSPADATRNARVEMGSMESVKQKVRAVEWESAAESVWQDIRYGLRQLWRNPGFSIVAVLTLALGIGANTAIFTLVHAVMLKQLPIAHPESLYRVGEGEFYCCEWGGLQDSWGTFDYPFYKHLRDTNANFERVAAFSGNTPSFNVRRAGPTERARTTDGEYVSGNYFAALGIQAPEGRLIQQADDRAAAAPVAVMGYQTWAQEYGGDRSMVGSTVYVNGLPVTLIGIAPQGFFGDRFTANPPALWIPLSQEPTFEGEGVKSLLYSSGDAWLYVIGRLKSGAVPSQVQAQLSTDLQQWLRAQGRASGEDAAKIPRQHIQLTAGGTGISPFRSDSKDGLYLLSAGSMLVLLIACANLANLLLARNAAREHQTALRLSLGATRGRLIRSVLTESVLLSVIGGALGVLLAYAGSRAIVLIAFRGSTYVPVNPAPSLPVLGFALALSVLTGVMFGVVPAWIGTYTDPAKGLRSSRTNLAHASRPQKALVVVQAALSIVLLAVAGLVTESLNNLEKTDLGFQTEGRLLANLNFKAAGYQPEQLPAAYEEIQDRLEAIPGVRSASLSEHSPQNLCCISLNILIGGRSESWIPDVDVGFTRVSPHYFKTMGTPVLRGRTFTRQDTQAAKHVAVIDQAFAQRFFAGKNAIGQHIGLSLPGHGYDYEIVGVVRNTKYRTPAAVQRPMFFVPFTQTIRYEPAGYQRLENGTLYAQSIQLHVVGTPESYEKQVRDVLASVNPNLALVDVKSYSEQVAVQFNQQRLIARLTGFFSLLALVLASIGLYGVTAYNVTRRTREIGVRMALGANRAHVVRMVMTGVFAQISIGLSIGAPLALLSGRALAHQLYQVSQFNPYVFGLAVLVLCICALIAAFVPARRAASIRPVEALRTE